MERNGTERNKDSTVWIFYDGMILVPIPLFEKSMKWNELKKIIPILPFIKKHQYVEFPTQFNKYVFILTC